MRPRLSEAVTVSASGSRYSKTRAIEGAAGGRAAEIEWVSGDEARQPMSAAPPPRHLLSRCGAASRLAHPARGVQSVAAAQLAGGSAARPWERVGGAGWADAEPEADRYQKVPGRPDLEPGSPEAAAAAEQFNDAGLGHFESKRFREAVDCFDESVRLAPGKPAFLGNRAAAALRLERWAAAAADARAAVEVDPAYSRGWLRLGQALLGAGEAAGPRGRADLVAARKAFKTALGVSQLKLCPTSDTVSSKVVRSADSSGCFSSQLEPGSRAASRGLKDAGIAFAAEFSDDDDDADP